MTELASVVFLHAMKKLGFSLYGGLCLDSLIRINELHR